MYSTLYTTDIVRPKLRHRGNNLLYIYPLIVQYYIGVHSYEYVTYEYTKLHYCIYEYM